jgi:steroid delta-isomerase-like uncharacterized protein
VLLTPGHTPGGQSVLVETAAGKVVITGFCTTMEHFEPTITPPPLFTDRDQLIESMQRVAERADILIPLHDHSFADIDAIPAPADTEANKALIQRMADALGSKGKTPELIDEFLASEEMKQHVAMFEAAFPGYAIPFEDILAEGDKVVIRGTFRGTHKGEFMGIAPTGKDVTMPVIVTYRIAKDKIVESWISADQLGLMQQLGAVTPGRPAPENYIWDEPSDVTGAPGAPEENKAIVHRVIEEFWNQKNVEVLDETHSPDSLAHNPAISASYPYPQTFHVYKEACLAYLTGLPDLQVAIDDTIAEEDKVALRWTATGTHKNELMGIPATDAQVEFSGTTLYHFADGKIVDTWWAWDALGLMQQLTAPPEKDYSSVFFMPLASGLNMISLPLEPTTPYTARSFAEEIGATVVIRYDMTLGKFVGFTLSASDDGFPIEGGEGYITNVLESKVVPFTGAAWTNEPSVSAAPPAQTSEDICLIRNRHTIQENACPGIRKIV